MILNAIVWFVALAAVMYVTRRVDWSGLGQRDPAKDLPEA